ncbi:restriction endonuclease subunit S [Elizabethkingia anophelis]|uniref:restriction endonuclease subunit S n=1 Tax=Elizabethkingia anophelis TaxID=1117645 RepID=UPI0003FAB2AE|nr:restriction endonuclease subunit S [Elizabethkingia anophelis]MCT4318710.1 restriction endonuclease subunit S [Elizabethkingia anophelis]
MENKKLKVGNVPPLRFPGFEGEWETKKLGEIMDFKVTNSFSRDNLNYENGFVKNIHYGDIHTKYQTLFDIANEVTPYINNEINIHRILEENYCQEGDVIFADASEDLKDVGKSIEVINLNGEKLLSGLHTLLARPQKNIFYLGFNGYLFKSNSVRTQIQKESQGTKVLSISTGRISKIKLSFPNLKEQQKIASFFSLIDQRIATQNKIIEQLETLIKGLREKLFSQETRFREFKDEWKLKRLREIGETFNGLSGKTKDNFGIGKPYIQYKQIFDSSKIQIGNCGLVEILETENQNNVQYGDVFFTISSETPNEIGMSSVLLDEVSEMYLNSFCFGYRPLSSQILNPLFSSYLFRSSTFRNEIVKLAQGSTRYNMSKIELMKLTILLPCLEEQIFIAKLLYSIELKIETEKKILEEYRSQKQYLLQNLFI